MAREYIRCMLCATPRPSKVFASDAPLGEAELMVTEAGGNKAIRWSRGPLPLATALVIRERLRAALEKLDTEIRAAEEVAE